MAESIVTQHAPAVKVGGRRLSVSSRHAKSHSTSSVTRSKSMSNSSPTPDYPRPPPPGEDQPEHLHTGGEEEVPPKKEKKHNMHDNEKKIRESPFYKVEMTRPTRDAGGKGGFGGGFGAAGRIAQPAGKGFGA
ncbi:hypothetical protein JOM56_006810 [Amanita muscaria]|uniref:Uncharacterized protein n=1 Tax=Amanita muscaria (strain Koide BX008) TaxID=946122 RepID=A0A0C2TVG6_AMAMK|nr:hypothetical protein M378DRAFT_174660 [Amanita muscaria Koide BX008]